MASRDRTGKPVSLSLASPWSALENVAPITMQGPSAKKVSDEERRRLPRRGTCEPGQVFLRDIFSVPTMQERLRKRPERQGYLELLHRYNGNGSTRILARIWEKDAYPPGIEALNRLVFTGMYGWLQRMESQGGNDLARVRLLVNLAGVNNPTFGTGRSALSAAENPDYLKLGKPIAVLEFVPPANNAGP